MTTLSEPATIAQVIASYGDSRPESPAFSCDGESLSWRELARGAARIATHLRDAGADQGDRVVIAVPNGPAFVQATLATWWIGATPTPLSASLPTPERVAVLEAAGPAVIIGAGVGAAGWTTLSVEQISRPAKAIAPVPVASPAWKANTSGGSTGRPKLIVANQSASASDLIAKVNQRPQLPSDSVVMVPAPFSHNAPFTVLALSLLLGNHVVAMGRFDPAECLALVEHHDVAWLYQVPTMMLRIWRLPEPERLAFDLSSLQVVAHMAAPCPPWLKHAWIEWLGSDRIVEIYGGTEQQAFTRISGTEWLSHPGSVGRVLVGEIEVRDPGERVLPPRKVGSVWMRRGAGAPVPYAYIGATAQGATGGWECFGDNGYFDEEGYLYLTDRTADMILVGGRNVYPAEIEAALDEHPAVLSSCVIGLADEDLGSVPFAIVQLAGDVPDEALNAWLSARIARHKLPRGFERVDEALRNEAGKVRRSQLRAARIND